MVKYYQDKCNTIFDKCLGKVHLSRKKFMFSFILSLMEQKDVQFPILATKLNETSEDASNLRRIQSFFADYELDYLCFAVLWLSICEKQKLTLCIDRSNWKFGEQNINILCLTAYCQGIGLPVFFELLDKKGNSNQEERIDLLQRFINAFGKERIGKVIGDREFIGEKWLSWLQTEDIPFLIRVPKHHLVHLADGQTVKPEDLLGSQTNVFYENICIDGVQTNIAVKKLQDDYLIVIGKFKKNVLLEGYRQRWSIETFFQAIKERGFDIEKTHLQDLEKLKKLIALVITAFLFCFKIGVWHHQNRKAIPIKNHGYKAHSFFRNGLNVWRHVTAFIESRYHQLEILFDILLQIILKNFTPIIT